jgi:hypothetical protein
MSDCKSCGRDDGHWIGCTEIVQPEEAVTYNVAETVEDLDHCAHGDCANPKRPKGKGRAPIYCDDHSDPKNRK